jgi:hypothetical protein
MEAAGIEPAAVCRAAEVRERRESARKRALHERVELGERLLAQLHRAERLHMLARLRAGEDRVHGELRLLALRLEGHRHLERLRIIIHVRVVPVHEPLGALHFPVGDAVGELGAVRPGEQEPPGAARLHLHLVHLRGEAIRAPPLRHVGRIRKRVEHQLARGFEHSRENDLPIGRGARVRGNSHRAALLGGAGGGGHRRRPFFASREGTAVHGFLRSDCF